MIRWLAGILLLMVIATVVVYGFIPSNIQVLKSVRIRGNANATARYLSVDRNWTGYRLGRRLSQVVEVVIPAPDGALSSWVSAIPTNAADTVEVQWHLSLQTGGNPFVRVGRYRAAERIGKQMETTLLRLRDSVRDDRTYGFPIRQVNISDSFLLIKKTELPTDPSVGQMYGLFGELRAYGERAGVVRTGSPMLNVTPLAGGGYSVETALPVDRIVPSGKGITFKQMVRIQFLMAEVRGGPGRVREAFGQLQNYMMDHQRTAMAIPFQSLVTDRSKEADTSRWVTRIYIPVFPFR
ncbi:GyrI-like domain-containing protein [Puia sp.]|jgi:hypothetical protein|uniref:GyrI-like domain-containing protein n=1 Tax=Puia sp. TaxID=2045100 RepID=UPI002F421D03